MAFNGTPQEYEAARAAVAGGGGDTDQINAVIRMSKQAGKSEYKDALKDSGRGN